MGISSPVESSIWEKAERKTLACFHFVYRQQLIPCLFMVLSYGIYFSRGRLPWTPWITAALVSVMAIAALLYAVALLGFIASALLGKLPGETPGWRRVKAYHLLQVLLHGLMAAWGIVFLSRHWGRDALHLLAMAGVAVYTLLFWNRSRRFREQRLSGG